jgi:hypothetical protein
MKVKHVRFAWDEGLHTAVKRAALDCGLSMAMFVEAAVRQAARPPQHAPPAPSRPPKMEPMEEPVSESMVEFAQSFAPEPEPVRSDPVAVARSQVARAQSSQGHRPQPKPAGKARGRR